jgi:hypothetical protein
MTSADASRPIRTLADPLAEALRLIGLADARGLQVRLMGGLAFHAQAPTWTARIDRDGRDLDLATRNRDRKTFVELLIAEGYTPDKQYNALYGHKQLYFVDMPRRRPVDILVDKLEMCHQFEFGGRLGATHPTLPLAELLMSKLQVVKINRKDVLDALILLSEHPLGDADGTGEADDKRAMINLRRILELTSSDWGWWRTTTGNLEKLLAFLAGDITPAELDVGRPLRFDPIDQVVALRAAIDAGPKSTKWKLRARVGERIPWYEEPEEVGHDQG